MTPQEFTGTARTAHAVALRTHSGQVDKLGVPYIEHVHAVASGLAALGPEYADVVAAGLLHDVVEDTDTTFEDLLAAGIPENVVRTVRLVTRRPGQTYTDFIEAVCGDRAAALVKIADNAHNTRPDRTAALEASDPNKARSLARRYEQARAALWAAATEKEVATIIAVINPALLDLEVQNQ